LALELLHSLKRPRGPDPVRTVIGDAGFADKHLLRWCTANGFVVIVRGRMDAQVHDLYVRQRKPLRGRPRRWGERICLRAYARDERNFKQAIYLYQDRARARLASVVGRHGASGLPMRFAIVRCLDKDDVVIMSTDLSLTPREITRLYADRSAIEMTFRELKQHFGLGHYQVRKPAAILASRAPERHCLCLDAASHPLPAARRVLPKPATPVPDALVQAGDADFGARDPDAAASGLRVGGDFCAGRAKRRTYQYASSPLPPHTRPPRVLNYRLEVV
jgi:hypothetical protein